MKQKMLLIKNKKAGIPAIAIIILLIAVIFIGIIYYEMVYKTDTDPNYPDPIDPDNPTAGTFGQDIVIEYTNGTLQSVKTMLSDPQSFTTYYNNQEVASFTWKFSGKASGDQDTVQIDVSDMIFRIRVVSANNPMVTLYEMESTFQQTPFSFPVDDIWHLICQVSRSPDDLHLDEVASGIYNLIFEVDGTIKYLDVDNSWVTADNPSSKTIVVGVSNVGGTLSVTFNGGVEVD